MSQEDLTQHLGKTELKWFRRKITAWGKEHLRNFPWRQTKDPYAIFVAEFLLQQTDAPRVLPVYQQLLEKYPTLNILAEASVTEIADILKPLGFHFRAFRLHQAAHLMIEDPAYRGKIPNNEAQLLKFSGVGKYTARAICAHAFGQSIAVLDTNITRILQRFFGLKPRLKRARNDPFFWEAAQQIAPRTNVGVWNFALIDFGAAVCTLRKPHCTVCPLRQRCRYYKELLPDALKG